MNKLDRLLLEQVISEELYDVLNEAGFFDKVKSGAKKLAAAGVVAGALASGGAQAAPDKPVKQQTTQVAKSEKKVDDFHRAMLGFINTELTKNKTLTAREQIELVKAQEGIVSGVNLSGKNKAYDKAFQEIKKLLKDKNAKQFEMYFQKGNPDNVDAKVSRF